jgi:hypothetical protein
MRRRCGCRAFFFERLAHRLVGQPIDMGKLNHLPGEQTQRPAAAAFGRG